MVIKIYFGEKPVFLCDEITKNIEIYRRHPDTIFIDEITTNAIHALLHEIAKKDFHAGVLYSSDIDKLKKMLWKHFKVIKAAGGLVTNSSRQVLMIYRRGKWDIPKGKLEEGEKLEDCAVREVQEETGLKKVTLHNFLLTTYHTYEEFGKHILKESYWYSMTAADGQALTPQTEEDILQIEWVDFADIDKKMSNTFPSVKDVIKAAALND